MFRIQPVGRHFVVAVPSALSRDIKPVAVWDVPASNRMPKFFRNETGNAAPSLVLHEDPAGHLPQPF